MLCMSILVQMKETPLHVACKNGRTRTALMLIDRGADVNQQHGEVCYVQSSLVPRPIRLQLNARSTPSGQLETDRPGNEATYIQSR